MAFQGLQTLYQIHLPKVDPALLNDLLVREKENKGQTQSSHRSAPFYIVEILTTHGTDSERMRDVIYEKTRLLPSVSENGTRYVANMRLSLELLKILCDSEKGIVKITGDYTGGVTGR
jgi:hypothetical protein